MRTFAAALSFLAALSCSKKEAGEPLTTHSYLGKAPPELRIEAQHWLNARQPVRLADLKGRVVWLEFSFLN